MRPLLERLNALEQEQLSISTERLRLQSKIADESREQPDMQQIRSIWLNLIELWEDMTDDQREIVMRRLIERVDVKTKTEGTCRIRISADPPSGNVGLTHQITPLAIIGSTYPGVLEIPLSFPRQKTYA